MSGGITGSQDPLGNLVASGAGGKDDPLGLYAINRPGGANYIASHPTPGGPSSIPTIGGPMTGQTMPGINTPKFYSPNSFIPASTAGGPFNSMAQQAAGPQYIPTLLRMMQQQPQGNTGNLGSALGNLPMMRHPPNGGKFGYQP